MMQSIDELNENSLQADLCIIGGGAAGITLATELQKENIKVLLLESGGKDPNAATQSLYEGTTEGIDSSYLHSSRLRYFGGTTNHWTGYCRPLDEQDFDGWPISYKEVIPYYQRAANMIDIHDPTEPDGVLDHFKEHNNNALIIDSESFQTRVFHQRAVNFGKRFGRTIEEAENIRVITQANLTSIKLTNEKRIGEIEVRSLRGKRLIVKAANYALCCGGLENTRILLNSEVSVLDQSGKIGVGFSEHPFGFSAEMIGSNRLADAFETKFWSSNASPSPGFKEPVKLVVSPKITNRTKDWPNFYFMLDPRTQKSDFHRGVSTLIGGNSIHFGITPVLEQSMEDSNRIRLGDDDDPLGVKRLHLAWKYSEAHIVDEILKQFASEMAWTYNSRLKVLPFDNFFLANHHMGTTRMGSSASEGVVDQNCSTFAAKNLFVCGSSVFPKAGANNPTLTILALTIRLADHVKSLNDE